MPTMVRLGAMAACVMWLSAPETAGALQATADARGSELAPEEFEVVIAGGSPGGIAAAITLGRLGHTVALLEYHGRLGGMSTSGLGKSDIEHREAIGGVFLEFVGRVRSYYAQRYGEDSENYRLCRDGYYYEPSVAEGIFEAMLAEAGKVRVFRRHRLDSVVTQEGRVTAASFIDRDSGERRTVRAKLFIDATYEGDLYAMGGADYRTGREARSEFDEPHAGVVYWDYNHQRFLPGTTGEGDDRIQAYTYRLCLTTDPANSYVLDAPPANYDRRVYLPYFDDLEAGRLGPPVTFREGWGYYSPHFDTLVRALSVTELPNDKTDVNINPRPLAFPFAEENVGYIEGAWDEREEIARRHRELTLGLLYFLQNDPDVPEAHREIARQYHLPLDEFQDNGHLPTQLYVREARRLKGLYTLNQRDLILTGDAIRPPAHADSIASGEFPIDSFPCRKKQPGDDVVLEGYLGMLADLTKPYHIPYRIMVPQELDGILVPVAASATHVAFGSIRMEPTWMAMGQAAGVAAHLCLQDGLEPREVPIVDLQRLLLDQGQRIAYLSGVDLGGPASISLQFFAARGAFEGYDAQPDEPLTGPEAARWVALARQAADPALTARSGAALSETARGEAAADLTLSASPAPEEINRALRWLAEELDVESPPVYAGPGAPARGQFLGALYAVVTAPRQP